MSRLSLSRAVWRFRDCSEKTWRPARVPGCVHTDLLRAGKIDPTRLVERTLPLNNAPRELMALNEYRGSGVTVFTPVMI